MCGILGFYGKDIISDELSTKFDLALSQLQHRGPNNSAVYKSSQCLLGHARLSIIDTSTSASQPMSDTSKRYHIVFNGEIFNYKELAKRFFPNQIFQTTSDTEILLQLYIHFKEDCLQYLNGFFCFAVYDSLENSLFLARDRYGEKPCYFVDDNSKFAFSSELRPLTTIIYHDKIDANALNFYLELNYTPAPLSMVSGINKLLPGHFIKIKDGIKQETTWYELLYTKELRIDSKNAIQSKLHNLLEKAVERRLVADVPLGSFLSGGIDSSIITALASKYVPQLKTFSVGFSDLPYYDESKFAQILADKYRTDHTVIQLSNNELVDELPNFLAALDEPFADSSAFAMYMLCKKCKDTVTVALSGDGADEVFGGYQKHLAEFKMIRKSPAAKLVLSLHSLWKVLPKSRSNYITNKFRQLYRFTKSMHASPSDRYWNLCTISNKDELNHALTNKMQLNINEVEYSELKKSFINPHNLIENQFDINYTLFRDMKLVLPYDMLTKVDMMSMANSLEVRSPFLDYELVNYAFTIPDKYKVESNKRKAILIDTFGYLLPEKLINRPKKGFEIPLLEWMRNDLQPILNKLTEKQLIDSQSIFEHSYIQSLKNKLQSKDPEDSASKLWAILVFQFWFTKYF